MATYGNGDINHKHAHLNGHVAPQTNQEGGFEVGESSDAITNHNIQKRSPIGLNLRLSASIINEIESTLNRQYKENAISQLDSKLKASNMPAIFLKIGSWEWVSNNEGGLVVKFYHGKKKLVWELLFGCRKKKMEIRWSQISAINTFVEEDDKARLEIELMEPPELYMEVNFQPKKHTQWKATKDDFTNGQARICRRHTVVFPPRVVDEPLKKLLQSDSRLLNLSRQAFPTHNYPHFQNQFLDFSSNNVWSLSNNDHHGAMALAAGHSNSSNLQIQDNRGMESWGSTQLPEHTNGSKPCYDQMTSVDQSYVHNGMVLQDPWLHAVGFDNSSGGQVMPYDETFMDAGIAFQESIDWLPADYCSNEFGDADWLNQMGCADNGFQSFHTPESNGDDGLFHNSNSNSNSNSKSDFM